MKVLLSNDSNSKKAQEIVNSYKRNSYKRKEDILRYTESAMDILTNNHINCSNCRICPFGVVVPSYADRKINCWYNKKTSKQKAIQWLISIYGEQIAKELLTEVLI